MIIVEDVTVPIGGGLSYTAKQWVGDISDDQVAGLSSLLGYLTQITGEYMTLP